MYGKPRLGESTLKVFYLPIVAVTLGKLVADVGWPPLLEDSLLDPLLEDALLDPAAATPGPLLADSSTSCPGCPSWRCPAKAITPLPFQNNYLTPAILCTPMGCTMVQQKQNPVCVTIHLAQHLCTLVTESNKQNSPHSADDYVIAKCLRKILTKITNADTPFRALKDSDFRIFPFQNLV